MVNFKYSLEKMDCASPQSKLIEGLSKSDTGNQKLKKTVKKLMSSDHMKSRKRKRKEVDRSAFKIHLAILNVK